MREQDRCGLPYVCNGDIRECLLHFNHGGDCADANHAAFLTSLRHREWQARNEPWL